MTTRNTSLGIIAATAVVLLALSYHSTPTAPTASVASTTQTTSSTQDIQSAPAPKSLPPHATAQFGNVVTIPVATRGTVLDAMQAYASTSNFTFTGENYPSLGLMIDSINGKKNADGFYWFLYINGHSSELGASSAQVSPTDVVEWRYEKNK